MRDYLKDMLYDINKAICKDHSHQRGVRWISDPVLRNDLTSDLRSSLKSPRTSVELTHRYKNIQIVLGEIIKTIFFGEVTSAIDKNNTKDIIRFIEYISKESTGYKSM